MQVFRLYICSTSSLLSANFNAVEVGFARYVTCCCRSFPTYRSSFAGGSAVKLRSRVFRGSIFGLLVCWTAITFFHGCRLSDPSRDWNSL